MWGRRPPSQTGWPPPSLRPTGRSDGAARSAETPASSADRRARRGDHARFSVRRVRAARCRRSQSGSRRTGRACRSRRAGTGSQGRRPGRCSTPAPRSGRRRLPTAQGVDQRVPSRRPGREAIRRVEGAGPRTGPLGRRSRRWRRAALSSRTSATVTRRSSPTPRCSSPARPLRQSQARSGADVCFNAGAVCACHSGGVQAVRSATPRGGACWPVRAASRRHPSECRIRMARQQSGRAHPAPHAQIVLSSSDISVARCSAVPGGAAVARARRPVERHECDPHSSHRVRNCGVELRATARAIPSCLVDRLARDTACPVPALADAPGRNLESALTGASRQMAAPAAWVVTPHRTGANEGKQ
jgi:hypothetical protein